MFYRICSAINKCGWFIVLLHLFGWLVWYGFANEIAADIACGSALFGSVLTVMIGRVTDLVEDSSDDDED